MTEEHRDNRLFVSVLFFIGGAVLLVLACWVLFYDASATKKPDPILLFTPKTVQFGSVSQEVLRGTAFVTNASDKRLDIVAVTKGCDCTEVLIKQGELLPGEQREISFQWDTHGRRGDTGVIIGIIYKMMNEHEQSEQIAPLTLKATVVPDFEISPSKLDFFFQTVQRCANSHLRQ